MSPFDVDLAYMIELIAAAIDENFGKGYAKAHPELIAAQIQAAAIYDLSDSISDSIAALSQ